MNLIYNRNEIVRVDVLATGVCVLYLDLLAKIEREINIHWYMKGYILHIFTTSIIITKILNIAATGYETIS